MDFVKANSACIACYFHVHIFILLHNNTFVLIALTRLETPVRRWRSAMRKKDGSSSPSMMVHPKLKKANRACTRPWLWWADLVDGGTLVVGGHMRHHPKETPLAGGAPPCDIGSDAQRRTLITRRQIHSSEGGLTTRPPRSLSEEEMFDMLYSLRSLLVCA